MNNNKLGFLPGYISWLTIVLVILVVVTFLAVSNPSVHYATRMGFGEGMMESSDVKSLPPNFGGGAPMMEPDYYPYPYPNPDVPITDTREFLKIYYNASMQNA